MQVLTSLTLFALACAGLGAVLIANSPTILPTNATIPDLFRASCNAWISQFVPSVQSWLRRAWGSKEGSSWDILYHLGGNGPWIQMLDGVVERDIAPPTGCQVEQVHMVSWERLRRHRQKKN